MSRSAPVQVDLPTFTALAAQRATQVQLMSKHTLSAATEMENSLQDCLDELVSTRTPARRAGEIISSVERLLAEFCTQHTEEAAHRLLDFVRLQDSFECNVVTRMLSWMASASLRLDHLTNRSSADYERQLEASELSGYLIQALSVVQGVALMHRASKQYLGRQYALQILIDILLTSRHIVSTMPPTACTNAIPPGGSQHTDRNGATNGEESVSSQTLASAIIDTLLCILVDSSSSLRVFEECKGLHAVVKILRRPGTPRESRMKCLEFLYWYLMDETNPVLPSSTPSVTPNMSPKLSPSSRENRPRSAHRPTHLPSSRNSSTSSTSSVSSLFSSSSSVSTAATSVYSSRRPSEDSNYPSLAMYTPPDPPTKVSASVLAPSPRINILSSEPAQQPRSPATLRTDIDYVPMTPKKARISRLGVVADRPDSTPQPKLLYRGSASSQDDMPWGSSSQTRGQLGLLGDSGSFSEQSLSGDGQKPPPATPHRHPRAQSSVDAVSLIPATHEKANGGGPYSKSVTIDKRSVARTTAEKKALLGTMLGNVDALVAGVGGESVWGVV
ncbi:hypothetical protein WOLCODRAFT_162662 [Wolfiporia cocos MD-104 SS10]|uniref:CDC14-domain-containing protein n=1 Tax=Wolfiporia cocos (strain MD-104) TaxID=742152 RepID=A0A2H3JH97_WOLCO|nr:hypothetical protein WOLCODRAFT_162662 [Wolfiporia cocos MD-104 SS10]